jgi:hypothetical protein
MRFDKKVNSRELFVELRAFPDTNELFLIVSDDITMSADGVDCYHLVKGAKRYK